MQVVSRTVVVAIGNREVLGIAVGDSEEEGFCAAEGAWPDWNQAGDLRCPPGADGGDQADVPGQ